jgi:hypothetical protein
MEINPNPAQVLTVETGESFFKVARRVQEQSARKIAHDNGKSIELDPDSEYSVCFLRMKKLLTPEQFYILKTEYFDPALKKAEKKGLIEEDQIEEIATAFSMPKQPPFPFDFPEGAGVKVFWDGTTTYRYEWIAPPIEAPELEE